MTSVHTLFCHTKAVDLNATVTLGICSHSVAVAELNKNLYEFVTSFKRSKRKPGFSELAVQQALEEKDHKYHTVPTSYETNGSYLFLNFKLEPGC